MNRSAIRFSLRGASGNFSTCTYHAIASMMQLRSLQNPLLVVGVCVFGKVDEVVRIQIGYLTASFVGPRRCVS